MGKGSESRGSIGGTIVGGSGVGTPVVGEDTSAFVGETAVGSVGSDSCANMGLGGSSFNIVGTPLGSTVGEKTGRPVDSLIPSGTDESSPMRNTNATATPTITSTNRTAPQPEM